jgi:hypothetical protein
MVEAISQDFIPVVGNEGYQIVHRAPGITTLADWIYFGTPFKDADLTATSGPQVTWATTTKFLLQKGDTVQVPYVINTPPLADPGSHFGVMLLNALDATPEGQKSQLSVGMRVGVLTFVTIPGSRVEGGHLLDFSVPKLVTKPPVLFNLNFENNGTVYFEPRGKVEIYNILNRKVGETPISGRAILPTGVGKIVAPWVPSGLLFGRYSAKATVISGDARVLATANTSFYALPLRATLIFLAIVVVVFILLHFVRRRLNISISVKK